MLFKSRICPIYWANPIRLIESTAGSFSLSEAIKKEVPHKPGFVYAAIYLGVLLPIPSSGFGRIEQRATVFQSYTLSLHLQRGLPRLQSPIKFVSSYLTVAPLPRPFCGRAVYFSVALSSHLRALRITKQPALWSPDFPHLINFTFNRHTVYKTQLLEELRMYYSARQDLISFFFLQKSQPI